MAKLIYIYVNWAGNFNQYEGIVILLITTDEWLDTQML